MNRRAGRLWRAGEDPGAALAGVRADARWPPRVLHIGNIGNNAYQNARILNSAGVPSDVLCYDYYHIMGCPEWEDADIPEVPAGFDENYPDWSKVALGGFVRPPWFAQGPLPLAALYLGRRGGKTEGLVRSAMNGSRRAMTWRPVRALARLAFRGVSGARQLLSGGPPRAVTGASMDAAKPEWTTRFRDLFPDRPDGLGEGDLKRARRLIRAMGRLLSRYDVVIGYATDCILPMVAGHPCFMAFEHGTIRSIPFEDSPTGRLTALAYRTAACAFVTNCDNIRAVERLGMRNARYIPHPMNDALFPEADPAGIRTELVQRYDPDFVVFHPSRHHWEAQRHPSWEKGNDILIKGFARFVREIDARALLVLVRWGRTVDESARLIASEGVEHRVHWIQPVPNRTMLRYIRASDVVADQFWLGTFGGIMPKAMACAKPVLLHLDATVHQWCFPELPPHVQSRTPDEVFRGLSRLHSDRAYRAEVGARSRAWYEKYHSEASIRDRLVSALRDAVVPQEPEAAAL